MTLSILNYRLFNTPLLVILLITIICPLDGVYLFAGEDMINLTVIARIESSNNPGAYNSYSGATGLHQITPICLADYNYYHRDNKLTMRQMFSVDENTKVATWYLEERIPQMLKAYHKEINITNILICYNAGITYVTIPDKQLPKETKNYIKKYGKFTAAIYAKS